MNLELALGTQDQVECRNVIRVRPGCLVHPVEITPLLRVEYLPREYLEPGIAPILAYNEVHVPGALTLLDHTPRYGDEVLDDNYVLGLRETGFQVLQRHGALLHPRAFPIKPVADVVVHISGLHLSRNEGVGVHEVLPCELALIIVLRPLAGGGEQRPGKLVAAPVEREKFLVVHLGKRFDSDV